jgi:hypothetical protein
MSQKIISTNCSLKSGSAPTTKVVGSEYIIKIEPTALVVGLQKPEMIETIFGIASF